MKCRTFFFCLAFFIGSISASLRSKIIGGEDATIRDFPYQASLRARGGHICGGCIISDKHILTAAHCITRHERFTQPYHDVSVSTGTSSSRENGRSHRIASITVHPEWTDARGKSGINDVAVVKLGDAISFNERQQKIKLPSHDAVSDKVGILAGWGYTSVKTNRFAVELQKINMRILNSLDCQQYHRIAIDRKQLCAFHSEGHGSCFGDSGSPLVLDNEVVGIVSWVCKGNCAAGSAEVFTNVYAQRDFIESAMSQSSNP